MNPIDLAVGALLAGGIALAAWRGHALTRSGALAAFVVGTLTYASGTLGFTLILLAFFVPSVVLSRIGKLRKRTLVDIGKAGARDALQVLANGGVATVCAVGWSLTHDTRWIAAFMGAYAAATADTWATEIGTLARGRPRSILSFQPVAPGMSGGITLVGTLAEAAGALWLGAIGVFAVTFVNHVVPLQQFHKRNGDFVFITYNPAWSGWIVYALAIAIAGFAGATLDSILGATLQELRYCDACGRTCETDPHVCGRRTRLVRGMPHMSNDLVNLIATAAGALIAFALLSFPSL